MKSLEQQIKSQYGSNLREDDIEVLKLDNLVSTSRIAESDKKYLEKFEILSELSACKLGLESLEGIPFFPFLDTVCPALILL